MTEAESTSLQMGETLQPVADSGHEKYFLAEVLEQLLMHIDEPARRLRETPDEKYLPMNELA